VSGTKYYNTISQIKSYKIEYNEKVKI